MIPRTEVNFSVHVLDDRGFAVVEPVAQRLTFDAAVSMCERLARLDGTAACVRRPCDDAFSTQRTVWVSRPKDV